MIFSELSLVILVTVISTGYCNDSRENQGHKRRVRYVQHFHDSFQHNNPNNEARQRQGSPAMSGDPSKAKLRLIPADDSLRHDFYPENVENALGSVRIQRRLRREPGETSHMPDTQIQEVTESEEMLDGARTHDLEEIFQILARRDGELLEQISSLRAALERLYGIFEFTGVAELPQKERDIAIRRILQRSSHLERLKMT